MPRQRNRQVLFHPILFAGYPTVFVVNANVAAVNPSVLFGPLFISVAMTSLLWWLIYRRVHDAKLSALYVSVCVLGFYSFSAVHELVISWSLHRDFDKVSVLGKMIGVCFLMVLVSAGLWFARRKHLHAVTYAVNVAGTVLVFSPIIEIGVQMYQSFPPRDLLPDLVSFEAIPPAMRTAENPPDIYYIVLDGYARRDLLVEEYDYDNSSFLESLIDQGFYVARNSRANYPWTLGSMASALNFAYLDEPLGDQLRSYENHVFLRQLLHRNRVMRHLHAAGYYTIVYESQYYELDLREADQTVSTSWTPSPFSMAILQMTPVPALLRWAEMPLFFDLHRARILSTLDLLPRAVLHESPKFVFAHLMYAHAPYVFEAGGESRNPETFYGWRPSKGTTLDEFRRIYRGQVHYLNTQLQTTIRRIIADSPRPPVIIVQGDHGPELGLSFESLNETNVKQRYSILNAYLFPNGGNANLYDSITPVNSFRVLFNHYFGTSYPLLEDKSYYTSSRMVYDFEPIPEARFQ